MTPQEDSSQPQQPSAPQPAPAVAPTQTSAQPQAAYGPPAPTTPAGPLAPPANPAPIGGQTPGYQQQPVYQQMPAGQMHLNQAYGHDKLAVASLVFGVISLPMAILSVLALPIPITGLVLGIVSLKRNRGMAIAGIVLSVIGLILSILVLVVGLSILHTSGTSSSSSAGGSTASTGTANRVDTDCYSFELPAAYTMSNVKMQSGCGVQIINPSSTEDLVIESAPLLTTTSAGSDKNAILKLYLDKLGQSGGSQLHFGASSPASFGGAPAYVASGTEDSATYKYVGGMTVLSPRAYTVDGASNQVFLFASDSISTTNHIAALESSFEWK